MDGVLNHTCVCDPGYTGPNCSTQFDVCTGVNCNDGSCVEGVGSCVCDPGYTGLNCLTIDDNCLGVNCNGGQCFSRTNSFECICSHGLTGTLCSDMDYCAGVNCTQNQVCVNGAHNYTCICDPDDGCVNANVSACTAADCKNGQCIDGTTSFTCICYPGFTGDQCEIVDDNSTIALAAAVVTSVLVVLLITVTVACSLVYAKKRQRVRHTQNTTGNNLKTSPVDSLGPLQSTVIATPDYDYPFLNGVPLEDTSNYNIERCPAYATINGSLSCKANPAYVSTTNDNVEEDENYYY